MRLKISGQLKNKLSITLNLQGMRLLLLIAFSIPCLKQAYAAFPDPEVASHLGEALWVNGQRDQALDIWRGALLKDPSHPLLLETLERLGVPGLDADPLNRGSEP